MDSAKPCRMLTPTWLRMRVLQRAGYAPLEDAFEDASVAVGCLGRAAEGYKQFIETFLQADKVRGTAIQHCTISLGHCFVL